MAVWHLEVVNKLVAASATYNSEGLYSEVIASIEGITPEVSANSLRESPAKPGAYIH